MPAPADAWALAATLIVTRTAAAAAKVVANFLMRPPTYCVDARVDDWCKYRLTTQNIKPSRRPCGDALFGYAVHSRARPRYLQLYRFQQVDGLPETAPSFDYRPKSTADIIRGPGDAR